MVARHRLYVVVGEVRVAARAARSTPARWSARHDGRAAGRIAHLQSV